MKNKDLLRDDEIEDIKNISNEEKKCNHILFILKYSSVVCFQKFILLLSENNLHADIVEKILEGNNLASCLSLENCLFIIRFKDERD